MRFTYTIQAGGVEERVSSRFNMEGALAREYDKACVRICEDLLHNGYITLSKRERSGDYTRQTITLDVP